LESLYDGHDTLGTGTIIVLPTGF